MSIAVDISILPYSRIVGQEQIKLALEIAYVTPQRLGGVLISGQRGTGKSTAVRAFAQMVYGQLPVTLPINATEDRVVGGWKIDALMRSESTWQPGLLEEANDRLLYVDEVNLLDDHIVNIILDVTSTGVLVVQRDGQNKEPQKVAFTLVGTMNPEEGGLRPQLLDRFGLMVSVAAETNVEKRLAILQNVLKFDQAVSALEQAGTSGWLDHARQQDQEKFEQLKQAKEKFNSVEVSPEILGLCIKLSGEFEAEGNRGDYVLAMAAWACAALEGASEVSRSHLKAVAPLALQHRRPQMAQSSQEVWNDQDRETLDRLLGSE
ncbi:magnesium chelatase [Leptolyngbya sp. 'hensonii']|uniref:AAA family ATPase n=1 Tax=Leptolyngbya sp. 'hensonii' TaxID=1922337 RepID=UPI00094F8454|nr:AAA family ATPase [Leptolyngbya sp. 'hensonii']OLP17412.1 magnesium chelatase [Leptolyngbya sp. 'hensonii']